jgi:hypothetical protein
MPEKSTVEVSAIRNLQGDHWLRDLEIEVQNNSGKPIYHIEIDIDFPEIVSTELDGVSRSLIIPLNFGRNALMNRGEYATSTDRSIQPGEKYVFKIPEANRKAIESYLAERNILMSVITKVTVRIYGLSFGDGTGFEIGVPFFNKQALNQQVDSRKATQANFIRNRASPEMEGSKRLQYAQLPAISSLALNNTMSPHDNCGPQGSGCQTYDRVLELCPDITTGPCARRLYLDTTASTTNPRCIGFK